MPTIKVKKEFTLPQLIEWLLESGKSECIVISNMNNIVRLEPYGVIRFSQEKFYPEETFTVEVEEPVTENTVFDKLISRYVFLSSKPSYAHAINESIKGVIEDRKKATHIYFENEDNELQLIWRNGGLVE